MYEKILVRPAWLSLVMAGLSVVAIVAMPFLPGFVTMGGVLPLGFALALSFFGLVSGIQGVRLVRTDPENFKGTGLAVAGIVLCSLELLPAAALLSCAACGTAMFAASSI